MGPVALLAVALLHLGGFSLGYLLSKAFGYKEREARTISIEVTAQTASVKPPSPNGLRVTTERTANYYDVLHPGAKKGRTHPPVSPGEVLAPYLHLMLLGAIVGNYISKCALITLALFAAAHVVILIFID